MNNKVKRLCLRLWQGIYVGLHAVLFCIGLAVVGTFIYLVHSYFDTRPHHAVPRPFDKYVQHSTSDPNCELYHIVEEGR